MRRNCAFPERRPPQSGNSKGGYIQPAVKPESEPIMSSFNENATEFLSDSDYPYWQDHFVMQEQASVEIANAMAKLIGHEIQGVRVGYDIEGEPEVVTTSVNRITGDTVRTAFQINTY